MNEHNLPPDELASAFLDDELAESAADAVRRDPELAARASALRRAADAVGEPVTPPAVAADAAVEAALADFDARTTVALNEARRHPRGLSVITGVAAAVAIGFIVAAAVGLFAEREGVGDADTSVAASPAPAPDAAAPPPAAEPSAPAPEAPPPAATVAQPQPAAEPPPPPAVRAPAPMLESQPDAQPGEGIVSGGEAAVEEAGAALAEAQAPSDAAREAAAAPPPAAADESEPADAADDMDDMAADPSAGGCDAAVGDGTVELQITAGETRVLIVGTPDGRPTALDGATCAEIPPTEPTDISTDPQPDDCAVAVGDGTVELQITAGETRVLIVGTPDGRPTALDGATCAEIPPTEPG